MPKSKTTVISHTPVSRRMIKQQLKQDATALAELIYDMYKDEQANGKIIDGQNNA